MMEEILKWSSAFIVLVGILAAYDQLRLKPKLDELTQMRLRLDKDRRDIYSKIILPFTKLFAGKYGDKKEKQNAQDKALAHISSDKHMHSDLMFKMIASDQAINSYNRFILASRNKDKHTLKYMGEWLLQLRIDMGNINTSLSWKNMLTGIIHDIDNLES